MAWTGRPYWFGRTGAPRPYYGTIVAGVALGTIVTIACLRPAPNLCYGHQGIGTTALETPVPASGLAETNPSSSSKPTARGRGFRARAQAWFEPDPAALVRLKSQLRARYPAQHAFIVDGVPHPRDVTGPQYTVITIIAGTPNTTVSHIAKTMPVSNQFITGEVGKLATRGIVEKSPDEADRRSMLLNLTPSGRNLLRELGPLRRESNHLMYRSLTGDQARMLQKIMDALIADGEIALHELDAPHRRGQIAPSAVAEIGTLGAASRVVRKHA